MNDERVPNSNALEILSFLVHALKKFPETIDINTIGNLLVNAARQNDKRPAFFQLVVQDDWVKNVYGHEDLQDVFIIARIPREVLNDWRTSMKIQEEISDISGSPV